ncbi:Putative oxidoreductase YteT precursor [Cognatishimia activa]|uniref:Putative oxidoreductase YteT n=2 Tax=Cognatishimia activa TaxID=1715691 RepID=A0A0P1IVC6_9RHOB|nr:Gfo/Idh/MocA family oxidoreductase [Cognatishimia activa]CUK27428.1 Putative oxidoreductase YteT precursor [Cognatishimia activa]
MVKKYGILGSGFMGQEHIRNLAFIEGCEVTAFFEPNAEMTKASLELVPDAYVADSLEDLVTHENIDALVIATPNYQHAEQLAAIAKLRTIPILVEKPLVTEPEDRAIIQDLAANYGAPIWVGMEYRYMPAFQRFLQELEGATGGVKHLTIREHRFPFLHKVDAWNRQNSQSGGTLVEKCCHFFDLMRLITGDEPTRVMGSGWQAVNHKDEDQPSDIWDAAFAVVDFEQGTRAMLDLCMFAEGAQWQEEISAVGPKGRIDCLLPLPKRLWPESMGPYPHPKLVIWPRDHSGKIEIDMPVEDYLNAAGDHHGSTYFQHMAFKKMLDEGGEPVVGLKDGWMAVQMGMAAQKCSDTGEAVAIDKTL